MGAYAQGDADAFSKLYRRYEGRIYSFFSRRLPIAKYDLSKDLFQKTWLKVHQARKSFDPSRKFSSWIFTVALNVLRDQLKLSSSKMEIQIDDDFASITDNEQIEERLVLQFELGRVQSALALLPEGQKQVLMLAEWEGLTGPEISEVMKISEVNIRQLLFRAKAKMRALLREEDRK